MNLTSETRVAILERMVQKAPQQALGRTQVMKLFYFLQELKNVSLGYDFKLFNYGPFDSEVLSDLSSACGRGRVVEETVLYSNGYGYAIKPGPMAGRDETDVALTDPDLAGLVDSVVQDFGKFSSSEMELRSTILFVDREFTSAGSVVTADDIAERVQQVKPRFDRNMIRGRVEEMIDKGYLQAVTACPTS